MSSFITMFKQWTRMEGEEILSVDNVVNLKIKTSQMLTTTLFRTDFAVTTASYGHFERTYA